MYLMGSGTTRLEGMKERDVFKMTSKEDAFNMSYLSSLSGFGRIMKLVSIKYVVSN